MKKIKPDCKKSANAASTCVLGALAIAAALPLTISPAKAEDTPESKTHALLNFEFSDKYLTPRGMIVQDTGLVFQQLTLGFFNLHGSDDFSATLVGGVWNCFGTERLASSDSGGTDRTSWYEIDPIAGMSFGFLKVFTLDVTYTAFNMQIFNIPFSQHLETKLSFDDSKYLKAFALHPYLLFWKELDNKAVANTDANPQESFYLEFGASPSFTIEKVGIKLEAPCRVLLPDDEFYGTGAGSSSTVGLYEVGVKASMPLKFMPKGYGSWSFHAGFKYMDFVDDNLSSTQGETETTQVYCGLSTFF
jgi:hypothetical protein